MSLVEIQQYDGDRADWKNIRLSKIRFNDDGAVVAPKFRILVDGEVVYTSRRRD